MLLPSHNLVFISRNILGLEKCRWCSTSPWGWSNTILNVSLVHYHQFKYSSSSTIRDLGHLITLRWLQKAGETKWDSSDHRNLNFFGNHYGKKGIPRMFDLQICMKKAWGTTMHNCGPHYTPIWEYPGQMLHVQIFWAQQCRHCCSNMCS